MIKSKKGVIFVFLFLFLITFVSSANFGYNNLEKPTLRDLTAVINYTQVNVNNSIYWDGHIWSEVSLWLYNQTYSGSTYNETYDLYAYNQTYSGSTYNESYVPYTGATTNVNLGANDLTVDTNVLHVDSTNNRVGIGTTGPTAKLDVSGDVYVENTKVYSGRSSTATYFNPTWDGILQGQKSLNLASWSGGPGQGGTGAIKFSPLNVEKVRIDSAGNVGIGTTAPTAKLDVNGNLNVTGDVKPTTTDLYSLGSSALRWLKGWFVDLDVSGNLNVTGNITGNQIYGGMWYNNYTATELNFAVDGTFYPLFFTEATHLNGFGTEGLSFGGNSNLTTSVGGLYLVNYMASGDGQNNHVYHTSVFINEVNQLNCDNLHKMAAGGDILTQTGTCMIRLAVNDRVSLRTADVGSTGTGNYYSANIDLVRIGN